jgi:hypothetical protein
MPAAGFEPTIPASERPQTHALDRTATGIGKQSYIVVILFKHHAFPLLKLKIKKSANDVPSNI